MHKSAYRFMQPLRVILGILSEINKLLNFMIMVPNSK